MNNNGDDCYFFYYSTCTKGDSCPFRHCEAAMGNETVCSLWQEGRCFRAVCKFRHMEITKNRKEIPCYWENQLAGCQKPHCAFFHEKPRYIDGIFVPPDKSQVKTEEQPQEEPAPPPPAPLPTAASNPQLRGVIKTEAQEPVPSPTHPPVVINPADDDEDEDDQFSEEGEDGKVGPSPRKLQKSGDSLNFGVSTLEEIRLRKALKASMKRVGYPIPCADSSTNGEKENIRSIFHPVLFEPRQDSLVFEETVRPRGSIAERLGRKLPNTDLRRVEGAPMKRSLAERLGRVVEEEDPLMPPQKALKPIKERLGLSAGSVSPSYQAETVAEPTKAPEQLLIKTLEQIKQEKAAKSQNQKDDPSVIAPEPNFTKTVINKPNKGVKRAITIKEDSISEVKTFSEILRAKKKRQEEQQEQNSSPRNARNCPEKALGKKNDKARPGPDAPDVGEVRVKTLEEIRREKAARFQAQQAIEADNKKSSDSEESEAKKPQLLRIKKPASPGSNTATETTPSLMEKPLKPQIADPETNAANSVKVKTFEEIMREKRLRKQEMEEQAKNSSEAEPSQKQIPEESPKRKIPTRVTLKLPDSSSSSSTSQTPDTTVSNQKLPVRKLVPFKSKAASPPKSTTGARRAADTSVSVTQSSPPPVAESSSQSPTSSKEIPEKNTKTPATLSPTKQTRAALQAPAAEVPAAEKTLNNTKKTNPEQTTDTRVRPKLNVKPSVVKPAAQVKPGQKRKAMERSAIAAVKPLNSTAAVQEEPLQETMSQDKQVSPSSSAEALQNSAVPDSPSTLLDSSCSSSSLTEELQTVPVFRKSQSKKAKQSVAAISVPAAREASTVPQSPVLKSPTQPKSRRPSAAASRAAATSTAAASTSALDDFDELISEFTDDQLGEEVDPEIGEDDLLQELSEMIDS
ncbi:zinc finger CCCH domain-containing protein 11A isoform X2 [Cheilinus undulatus]|uniref:zinc finger CCCH domain-containing protein 11A isoform X2 n=1 Tax=Cheilinus undulatus TaxID=241271 RepID=UPI001BD5D75E|nr:zinc finger CCCH domain-containing protein 11A isoform X2 [Cheilinus undulatus]